MFPTHLTGANVHERSSAEKAMNPQRQISIDAVMSMGRLFTPEDVAPLGVAPWTLTRLASEGIITRVAKGIYLPPGMEDTYATFAAEAAMRIPGAVICLRSAAALHGLTNEIGRSNVYVAMPQDFRPRPLTLCENLHRRPVHWVRWIPQALSEGIETIDVHGVDVSVTSPARTVVDYFRYAGHGRGNTPQIFQRDEAVQALGKLLSGRENDPELERFADIFGMRPVIEPLIEGMHSNRPAFKGGAPW
jgi:predicted transcriptional regulator of viral defense system